MRALSGHRLFSVGDTSYIWEDMVLAAYLWGDWVALRRRAGAGLACLRRLDDLGAEDGLDEDEVEAAAAEFRYERDLIAAEDMEAWLDERGLTADGWLEYIRRSLLVEQWAADLEEIQQEYPVGDDEVDEVIVCEAICGGHAAALASRLAARAAVYARTVDEAPDRRDGVPADEVKRILAALPADVHERGLPELTPEACRARLEPLARIEAVWQRFAASLVTPPAIRAQLAVHQLDWIRLSVRSLSLRDPDAAREVALCVREDGRDLAEVATEVGADLGEAEWYLDEVDASLRDHLVGAQGGDFLGPLPLDEGYVLVSVIAKQLPSEEDPNVRARAERALLARAVNREVGKRVRWHESL